MTSIETAAPAPTASLNPIRAVLAWQARRRQQMIDRRAYQRMLKLDEHMLRDIGVSRADVEWASALPLGRNAALELQRTKRQQW